jgi:hypothetical protein
VAVIKAIRLIKYYFFSTPIFTGSHHVNPKRNVFRMIVPVLIPAFLHTGIDKINSNGCPIPHMQVMISHNVRTVSFPIGKITPKITKSQPRIAPGIIKKYQKNLLLNISFLHTKILIFAILHGSRNQSNIEFSQACINWMNLTVFKTFPLLAALPRLKRKPHHPGRCILPIPHDNFII